MPNKSALCRFRQKISYLFFQDAFLNLINRFEINRRTFNGLRVYATDGFEAEIPRTADIVNKGFRGRKVSQHSQTYYPRLYLVHTYDVLSRVSKALWWDHLLDEYTGAEKNIESLEKESVTIHDRLYISKRMMRAHFIAGNYFLMRCKTEGGLKTIREFAKSKAFRKTIYIDEERVELVKVKNPQTGNAFVLATNLPAEWVNGVTLKRLYNLRWEVENSFRDLTENLKIESWHSKTLNGVLQELYARFWLMNYARIQIAINEEPEENPLSMTYRRTNFKLILSWLSSRLKKIFQGSQGVLSEIGVLIKISTEKRRRFKRSYPRQTKYSRKRYESASVIYAWELDMS